jgi:ketosteroid isomerase-like protein
MEMKQSNKFFRLFLISAIILLVNGHTNLKVQENSESSQVEAANQSFYKAFATENIDEMSQVWSHSSYVSAIHPISLDITVGWEGVKQTFVMVFGNYKNIVIVPKDIKVHVEGNVAWVMNHEEFQAMQGDKKVTLTSAAINIFVKTMGKWLMVHHQATVPVKL